MEGHEGTSTAVYETLSMLPERQSNEQSSCWWIFTSANAPRSLAEHNSRLYQDAIMTSSPCWSGWNRNGLEVREILTTAHQEFDGCAHCCAGKLKRREQDQAIPRRRGHIQSGTAKVSLWVWRWACKLRVGRWDSRCFRFVWNGHMCWGMVFTTLGMLTKQMLMQHPFQNAIDGLGRSGMGSGLVRNCLGGVWTASRHS